MTRWPQRAKPPRVEPPEWVRVFHPEDWSTPDEQELLMGGDRLPPDFRRWHAERRWVQARNDWFRVNPDADNRLEDMRERIARRRAARG